MRVLKKYSNRRLYDTETSSYIKLEDVQRLIVQFQPVQVIDIATNEDITEQILLSIISNIESQKSHQKILTRKLLEQLIRMYSYDYSTGTPLGQFLENALRFYEESTKQMSSPLHVWGDVLGGSYELWKQAFGMGMPNQPQEQQAETTTDATNQPPDGQDEHTDKSKDATQPTQPTQPTQSPTKNKAGKSSGKKPPPARPI